MPVILALPRMPITNAPGRFLATSTPRPAQHTICLARTASLSLCLAPMTRLPNVAELSIFSPGAVDLRGSTLWCLEVNRWRRDDHDLPPGHAAGAYGLCYGCARCMCLSMPLNTVTTQRMHTPQSARD